MERVARAAIPDSKWLSIWKSEFFDKLFLGFEPIRISVQGELIRGLDTQNTNNSQHGRKAGLGDSDDEEQQTHSTINDRSTMDIYRLRRQKRVKLAASSSDQATAPVLT